MPETRVFSGLGVVFQPLGLAGVWAVELRVCFSLVRSVTYPNGDMLVSGPLTASSRRPSKESVRAGGCGRNGSGDLFLFLQSTLQVHFLLAFRDQKTMNFPTLASRLSVQCSAYLVPSPSETQVYGNQALLRCLQS